jgi:hypothetical protein
MVVPYLIYDVRVELPHITGLLRFIHRGQRCSRVPFVVMGVIDHPSYCVASSGGSMSLSYGPGPHLK